MTTEIETPETPETPAEDPVETPAEEPAEEVRDPRAVLAKNKQLLADLKVEKERTAALAEFARAVGGDEAAADPRGHLAKRAESAKAEEHRARVVTQAALLKLANEQRTLPKGGAEEVIKAILADPGVKVDGDQITGLDAALRIAPRKPAPGPPPPWSGQSMQRPASPKTLEELQARGPDAVNIFAQQSPETYAKLRADWQTRLANPTGRK